MASAPYEEEYSIPSGLTNPESECENKGLGRAMGGAAVVGGVAGLMFVGPVVGLAAAGGAAALATTKGKVGEVTRATGEVVASAGSRLKKLDEKHHITDKAAKGVISAGNQLKKLDQKHHITDKAAKGVVKSANWVSKQIKPNS